ncbi:MAG: hypothetical protein M0042_07270 [Nitrospiraceae bacterium]|nr:hypothetical protein [Nitrospiraceae bacterium]
MKVFLYNQTRGNVMDILFIGVIVALFVASWLFMELIERVG